MSRRVLPIVFAAAIGAVAVWFAVTRQQAPGVFEIETTGEPCVVPEELSSELAASQTLFGVSDTVRRFTENQDRFKAEMSSSAMRGGPMHVRVVVDDDAATCRSVFGGVVRPF